MRFAPRTIVGQFISGSLIVQAVVFSAFLLVTVRREFREAQVLNQRRLVHQTQTMVDVLQEPLARSDADMLDHMLRVVPVSLTIAGVRITSPAGDTIRRTGTTLPQTLNARERQLLPEVVQHPWYHLLRDEEGNDQGVQAVVVAGVVQGVVWVTRDSSLTRRIPIVDLENLANYAGCALLGNLLLVWWLSASITWPLRQLRQATQHVQHHAHDLSPFPLPATVPNEAGELQASFNAMVNEITLQRQGTQDTLNLLDATLGSAPVGFAFFDRELRFVRLNETLALMDGVPLAAHLGARYRDLLPRDASADLAVELEELLLEVFLTGEAIPEREMSTLTHGSEELRTWQAALFPVREAQDEVRWVGVIVMDVTERKRAEEAMRRSERLASAGRLAVSIAHEINDPLESVTNLLYLLQRNTSLDAEGLSYVSLAQSELGRVGEVTQQTLKFYRRPAQPMDVRMPEVLRSVLTLHRARLRSAHIELKLTLSDRTVSFGYPGELRQVFANLIANAMDAMAQGGTLTVRAQATRRMGRQGVRVTVADTGYGMTQAVLQRVFEPFFTTRETTGTGLGLWVSMEMLARHRATVLVRSRVAASPGAVSGTVFSIFFPYDGVRRGPVRVEDLIADQMS